MDPAQFKCQHYSRKCKFVTPCCDGLYRCRFCHDEEQEHTLRRDDVTRVECSQCNHRQEVREFCDNCGLKFGKYFCYDCKLYDDEDKQQFHCSGCGICRVGGRINYFHCDRCDMCLPNHLQGKHKCVERVSRSNCPVCQEDIHTSRIPSQIPPCNHLIHKTCFDQMLAAGHYACPLCGTSMMDMKDIWAIYDREISETPMPEEYVDLYATIQCRDCLKPTLSAFHIMGMKCGECGSYNTVRDKGPLVRKNSQDPSNTTSETAGASSTIEASLAGPGDDLPASASTAVLRLDHAMEVEPMDSSDSQPLPHQEPVPMLGDAMSLDTSMPPQVTSLDISVSRELTSLDVALSAADVTLTPPYTPDNMHPLAPPPVYLRGSLTPQPSPPRDSGTHRDIDANQLSRVARRISFEDSNPHGDSEFEVETSDADSKHSQI